MVKEARLRHRFLQELALPPKAVEQKPAIKGGSEALCVSRCAGSKPVPCIYSEESESFYIYIVFFENIVKCLHVRVYPEMEGLYRG